MTTYPTAEDLSANHCDFRDLSVLLLQGRRCRCYPTLRHLHGMKNLQRSSTSSSDTASDSNTKAVTSPASASE